MRKITELLAVLAALAALASCSAKEAVAHKQRQRCTARLRGLFVSGRHVITASANSD